MLREDEAHVPSGSLRADLDRLLAAANDLLPPCSRTLARWAWRASCRSARRRRTAPAARPTMPDDSSDLKWDAGALFAVNVRYGQI
jgi:hypothetical protein